VSGSAIFFHQNAPFPARHTKSAPEPPATVDNRIATGQPPQPLRRTQVCPLQPLCLFA